MKNILPVFILVFFSIPSCKKDTVVTPLTVPDDITSRNFSPYIRVSSVNSTYFHPWAGCEIPSPSDSSYSYSMDLDSNMTTAFLFSASTTFNAISTSSPCANYHCMVNVTATDTSYSFAQDLLFYGDVINAGYSYFHSTTLCASAPPYSLSFSGEKYLAFRKRTGPLIYYGWIKVEKTGFNGIAVKSCAINNTAGNPITAGQTN